MNIFKNIFWIASAIVLVAVIFLAFCGFMPHGGLPALIGLGVALPALGAACLAFSKIDHAVGKFARIISSGADLDTIGLPDVQQAAEYPLLRPAIDFLRQSAQKTLSIRRENEGLSLQLQLLQQQKQNTEAVIQSISDAVIVTDSSDRVLIANQAAQELFGFTIPAGQLQTIDALIRDEDFSKMVLNSRKTRQPHIKSELAIKTGGQPRTFDCIISCLTDTHNQPCGVVAVLHDITREKEISQMKNDFVSHVSHELKTPLASISAYAEMLVDGEAQDQKTIGQFCSIIQSQAQRLNRLIEDILNISRIESGLVKVKKEPLSVALLITDAVRMITSYAQEKNITINTQAPIIFDRVYADKDMITQVVINLLSNAVKYTPSGGSITVNSEVNDADRIVSVTITDTGVGIAPEELGRLFEKFYRVEANKKHAKGTGLGLNLVKQIIEKVHGGRVFVKSRVNEGSTFGFELSLMSDTYVTNT